MPILQVEVVGRPSGRSRNLAGRIADAAAKTLKASPGSVWVRPRVLPRRDYAECGAGLSRDIRPVFVSLLKARAAPQKALQKEAGALAQAIAEVCARPVENVHVFYEPPAAGRAAFGGRML